MIELSQVKQRFGIYGNSEELERAMKMAIQVAPTDISVIITGESGTGKEVMPKIIHHSSQRKHENYIAVNCGAIPEGTIDSELFGHEKGAFTGASDTRKGYFEVANGGTIFLDEVGELPLATQVRLLRVLETGEFIKVGSSEIKKTNVRVIGATNVNLEKAVTKGKFREDLYYRLNNINIRIPPLRKRKDDVHLLFRKFAADFAEKYAIPPIKLTDDAFKTLIDYNWPGNIRQLKNIAHQISILEKDRTITSEKLEHYIPKKKENIPVIFKEKNNSNDFSEREILYKVLFDMKNDLNDLKKVTSDLINGRIKDTKQEKKDLEQIDNIDNKTSVMMIPNDLEDLNKSTNNLTLQENEKILIKKSLSRNDGKRKEAAEELGISERTLYRKIKEYNL